MKKYLVADDKDRPIGIVHGVCGIQHLIEDQLKKHKVDPASGEVFYSCIEEFRVYELGEKLVMVCGLETIKD